MKTYIFIVLLAPLTAFCMESERIFFLSVGYGTFNAANPNKNLLIDSDILEREAVDDVDVASLIMPGGYYGPKIDLRAGTIRRPHLEIINILKGIHRGKHVVQDIILSYNALGTVPKELTLLTSLRSLNLSHNNLNVIPVELFKNLVGLQYVDLSSNTLQILPEIDLPELESFNISHNPDFADAATIESLIVGCTKLRNIFIGRTAIPLEEINKLKEKGKHNRDLTIT